MVKFRAVSQSRQSLRQFQSSNTGPLVISVRFFKTLIWHLYDLQLWNLAGKLVLPMILLIIDQVQEII